MLDAELLDILETNFGKVWVSGDETHVLCPYCERRGHSADKSGHLAVNFGKNVAHCVRCDWGCKNVGAWLQKRGIESVGNSIASVSNMRRALDDAKRSLKGEKYEAPYVHQTLDYPDDFEFFSDGDEELSFMRHYVKSMTDKHLSIKQLEKAKVGYCTTGRTGGYVVFPFIEDGKLVYWQGRAAIPALLKDKKLRKYNPSKRVAPLGKNYWFYGMNQAVQDGFCVLCEGPLDQISLNRFVKRQYGDSAYALSVQGHTVSFPAAEKHPMNSQIGKLYHLRPNKICVLYDADVKEQSDALVDLLQLAGFDAFAGNLPKDKDPNDFHKNAEVLLAATTRMTDMEILKMRLNNLG